MGLSLTYYDLYFPERGRGILIYALFSPYIRESLLSAMSLIIRTIISNLLFSILNNCKSTLERIERNLAGQ